MIKFNLQNELCVPNLLKAISLGTSKAALTLIFNGSILLINVFKKIAMRIKSDIFRSCILFIDPWFHEI